MLIVETQDIASLLFYDKFAIRELQIYKILITLRF